MGQRRRAGKRCPTIPASLSMLYVIVPFVCVCVGCRLSASWRLRPPWDACLTGAVAAVPSPLAWRQKEGRKTLVRQPRAVLPSAGNQHRDDARNGKEGKGTLRTLTRTQSTRLPSAARPPSSRCAHCAAVLFLTALSWRPHPVSPVRMPPVRSATAGAMLSLLLCALVAVLSTLPLSVRGAALGCASQSLLDSETAAFAAATGSAVVQSATSVRVSAASAGNAVTAGGAFLSTPYRIRNGFRMSFSFQVGSGAGSPGSAEGFAFVMQTAGTNALGSGGQLGGLTCMPYNQRV